MNAVLSMRGVQLQGFTHAGKICECSVEHERNSVARIHTRGRSVNAVLSMRGIQLQGFTHGAEGDFRRTRRVDT